MTEGSTTETEAPFRVLPAVDDRNRHFWTGGERGELTFLRCDACGYLIHPPAYFCPRCEGRAVTPHVVSGRGTVLTYTVNHQFWMPGPELPYVVAIVGIEEQDDVRLMTNIVDCPVDAVEIGMPVEAVFEQHEEVWIPLFRPRAAS